jgi:hypothetical protein
MGSSVADSDYSDAEAQLKASIDAQLGQGGPVRQPPAERRDETQPAAIEEDSEGRLVWRPQSSYAKELPNNAPVRALGTFQNRVYFLDAHFQLRELAAKDVNRTMILHLFGAKTNWIYDLWPTLKKGKEGLHIVTGWDGTQAQESLLAACARRGVWRPQDHVRGRGAWIAANGLLVIHAGDRLYFSDRKSVKPGLIGADVYPAAIKSLSPTPQEGLDAATAAAELLDLINSWRWKRDFDGRLLMGWMIAAMIAGALKIRPLCWVSGEKGTGKSSLVGQDGVIHLVFGDGILMTANTTAAGLYQKIGYDSLPVSIDEIEAKRGNQKTEAVIELARQAYSGGMVLRGGADHEGKEFRAMCPVLFGSILIPPLMPQDLSRLALLSLDKFEPGSPEPDIDPKRLGEIGKVLQLRLLDKWGEWPERLQVWRDYLQSLGHDARASGQFGTLLAAVDLMMHDNIPTEAQMEAIAGEMKPTSLKETQVESSNADRCVGYAMSRTLTPMRGGEQMMISELVACAVRRYGGYMSSPVKPKDALRYLERSGVSVLVQTQSGDQLHYIKSARCHPRDLEQSLDGDHQGYDDGVYVAFAPDGDGILELFRGSDWEGLAGAHNPYVQALERVTGARRASSTVRIGVRACRPIMIPIAQCVDLPSKLEMETARDFDGD